MRYIPVHKKTGQRYPSISEKERAENWSNPPYSRNFYFEPVAEPPAPIEAKKVESAEKKEKEGQDPPKG